MTFSLPGSDNTCACILAGGRATRMDGQDKGLLRLDGQPLVAHVIERLAPQIDCLFISANRNRNAYGRFGLPVLADSLADYPGPLAGILTALQHSERDWLLSVPCDGPFLPRDLFTRMAQAVAREPRPACVVQTADGLQPTYCLLHRSLQDPLRDYLQQGGRRAGQWLKEQDAVIADFTDAGEAFININTPDELNHAQHQA